MRIKLDERTACIWYAREDWSACGEHPRGLLWNNLPKNARVENVGENWQGPYRISRPSFWFMIRQPGFKERFPVVFVVEEKKLTGERCDTQCQEAKSEDCNCRCLGRNHGGGDARRGWLLVGETTLVERPGHTRIEWEMRSDSLTTVGARKEES